MPRTPRNSSSSKCGRVDTTRPTGCGEQRRPSAPDAEFPRRAFAGAEFDQPAGTDAATVITLGIARDDDELPLRAGEATSAVLLAATHLGLAPCPLIEPLEIAEIGTEIGREVLGANISQSTLIRCWPDTGAGELPQTPRRLAAEVFDRG